MQTFNEFLRWEDSSNDIIDFKKIYVDMAGDLIAGLVLSELIYWYLPSKDTGRNKLRVKHDGYLWIASRYKDWHDRARITESQAERAIKILVDKGLLIKAIFKFNGEPTVHVRIVEDKFLSLLQQRTNSVTTENEFCSDRHPLTKTTTEITAEITNIKSIPQAVTQEPIREPCDPDGITESMELGYGGIRKKDVRYSHAAYRAFYEVTNRKPNKSIIDTLIEILGDNPDVPKLKSCFIEWIARGYNPQSYKWVDWYADGIPGRKPNEIKAFRPTAPDDEFYDVVKR